MRTFISLITFATTLLLNSDSSAATKTDTLSNILKSKEQVAQKHLKIGRLCYDRFLRSAAYDNDADAMIDSLSKYKLSGKVELKNFIQILILRRKFELEQASKQLTLATGIALQNSEKTFLYLFHLNQAYVQTDLGNALSAVYNYRMARKIAEEIGDPDFFVTTDIGISDIYTTIGLYAQAIVYLDQAQEAVLEDETIKSSSQTLIYLNKAEIYFKTGQLDSLRRYAALTKQHQSHAVGMDRNLKRLKYFELILSNKHELAIPIIRELLHSGNQYYKKIDRSHLAECYYQSGQLDSALITAKQLIDDTNPTPSALKLEAYKVLSRIFYQRNQPDQANHFLALALKESEDYTLRISKIGDLASELRLDRIEAGYHARNVIYEKERTILIMAVIGAVLGVIAILVSYRNIRQKNSFQKLLHQARSRELAFINSHQVRRPLANILGICNLGTQKADLAEMEKYVQLIQQEAKEMDDKLKEIENRLRTQA